MLVDPYALPGRLFTNEVIGMWEPPWYSDSGGDNAPPTLQRHGIVTLSAPGMTAAKTAQSQPCSAKKTVPLECFEKISRTCRLKAASGARSTQKRQHGRNEQLITANQKTHEQDHQGARIEARSARRNHSSFRA